MAELRWILLVAGLLFLAGLTAWEKRRPRQGRGDTRGRAERSEPTLNGAGAPIETDMPTAPLTALQPAYATASVGVPAWDYDEARDGRHARDPRDRAARVPLEAPVQVELPPLDAADFEPAAVSFEQPAPPQGHEIPILEPGQGYYEHTGPIEADPYAQPWEPAAAVPTLHAAGEEQLPISGQALVDQQFVDERFVDQQIADQPPEEMMLPAGQPTDPIVDWPPEEQRHILSIRVVGVNPDRMAGRPLRQALSACGFVHGKFGIFHQPGADGRALISAANLNKPGVFDPTSMDFERFRGLGLFAVLPGPLPPAAALDHLLDTAGDLAQRLHARLQDEHGMPLDEERLESMARIVQGMTQGLRAEPAA